MGWIGNRIRRATLLSLLQCLSHLPNSGADLGDCLPSTRNLYHHQRSPWLDRYVHRVTRTQHHLDLDRDQKRRLSWNLVEEAKSRHAQVVGVLSIDTNNTHQSLQKASSICVYSCSFEG